MIRESSKADCIVCQMLAHGVHSATSFYFAGITHGSMARRLDLTACPGHFASWRVFECALGDMLAARADVSEAAQ